MQCSCVVGIVGSVGNSPVGLLETRWKSLSFVGIRWSRKKIVNLCNETYLQQKPPCWTAKNSVQQTNNYVNQ